MKARFYLKDAYEIVDHEVTMLGKVKEGEIVVGMKVKLLGNECVVEKIEHKHRPIRYAKKGMDIALEISGMGYDEIAPHIKHYLNFTMHAAEFHGAKKPWHRKILNIFSF